MLMTLSAYVHQIDPFAIWPIRWYGLSYLIGFTIGWWMIRGIARAGNTTVKPAEIFDLVVTLAISIVIGGRLGYVVFYQHEMLWGFNSSFPFWDVLAINRGGMASHGGLIGVMFGSWWYARRHKHSWAHIVDLGVYGAPLGLFFGRVANFINGELYGREAPENLPWGVKFPQEIFQWDGASIGWLEQAYPPPPAITGQSQYVHWFIEQIQAGNQEAIKIIEPLLTTRHPSQIYEALLEGLVLFAILAIAWMKPRKPLFIFSLTCLVYAGFRIIVEFYREPDAHLGLQASLSRGQWLSIAMIAASIVLMIIACRRNVPKMGGWLKAKNATDGTKPT